MVAVEPGWQGFQGELAACDLHALHQVGGSGEEHTVSVLDGRARTAGFRTALPACAPQQDADTRRSKGNASLSARWPEPPAFAVSPLALGMLVTASPAVLVALPRKPHRPAPRPVQPRGVVERALPVHRLAQARRRPQGHYLRKLLERLPSELLNRLEALYRQAIAGRTVTLVAFISTQRPERPKGPPSRRLDALKDFCAYLDEDLGLWGKRFAWEQLDGEGKWRHYLTDLDGMLDFLDRSEQLAADLAKEKGLVK